MKGLLVGRKIQAVSALAVQLRGTIVIFVTGHDSREREFCVAVRKEIQVRRGVMNLDVFEFRLNPVANVFERNLNNDLLR